MWSGRTIYIFKSSIYFTWIRLSQEIKSIDNLIDVISANQSFNDPEGLDFDLLCSLLLCYTTNVGQTQSDRVSGLVTVHD